VPAKKLIFFVPRAPGKIRLGGNAGLICPPCHFSGDNIPFEFEISDGAFESVRILSIVFIVVEDLRMSVISAYQVKDADSWPA